MAPSASTGLNDSGVTRIVRAGALHQSCAEATSRCAHVAWKVHVGIDAPIWVRGDGLAFGLDAGVRAFVAPPGWAHATGAAGLSCAVFVAPGRHGAPWRGDRPAAIEGAAARALVDVCRRFATEEQTPDFIAEVARLSLPTARGSIDRRVERALVALERDPDRSLAVLAKEARISLDHLSRLVTRDTGIRLRRHALWSRLLRMLGSDAPHDTLAAVAFDAGFADHAHLSRTYRAFLGRAPSEFDAPPTIVQPWSRL